MLFSGKLFGISNFRMPSIASFIRPHERTSKHSRVITKATNRPECAVFIATSIDGFLARACGSVDWLDPIQSAAAAAGDDLGYQAFYSSVDVVLIGRKTYNTVRQFPEWPYATKRCLVLTHGELGSDIPRRPNGEAFSVEAVSGEPEHILAQLWEQDVQRVYIDGGATIQSFQAAGFVDDLTVSVVPVILGDGIPLFQRGSEQQFQLINSVTSCTGLVQMKWRAVRG